MMLIPHGDFGGLLSSGHIHFRGNVHELIKHFAKVRNQNFLQPLKELLIKLLQIFLKLFY